MCHILRTSLFCLIVGLIFLGSNQASAQEYGSPDVGGAFLFVGLPVIDGAIFMGGVAAAVSGTIRITDGVRSAGTRSVNFGFGAANAVSSVAYIITMAVEPDLWPYLLWPLLAHAGLATANFIIGYSVGSRGSGATAQNRQPVRLAVTPLFSVAPQGGTMGGLSLTLVHF
jgi:hypothetical protein